MYELYMNGILMPVAPEKVQIKTKNKNKTVDLINDGEVNIAKESGLKEISFDLLLPNQKYPFSQYSGGFRKAKYYTDALSELKDSAKHFQFILTRKGQNGTNYGNTNITVTVEDLTITDDAKEGVDIKVAVKLKEWKPYGTKTFVISTPTAGTTTITEEAQRIPSADAPTGGGSYTVQKGDSLWKIAKAKYGNGADYQKILELNKDKIKNPNLIYPGQSLILP